MRLVLGLVLLMALMGLVQEPEFDPLATARQQTRVANPEAQVPPQCYTRTDGKHNPCYTCHTRGRPPNYRIDWHLQEEYAFSDHARKNHWRNLRMPPAPAELTDSALLAYIREDNYTPLRHALARLEEYPGFVPDLDLGRGFDAEGFALDGSGWRAFRYKPFPGTFWPSNGRGGDAMVRLPAAFRSRDGQPSREIYKANLALLEAAIAADPRHPNDELVQVTEPLDERLLGHDLDRDGRLTARVTRLRGLPERFFGDASRVPVTRYVYPESVEFLHTLRYLDPDAPSMLGRRLQELRHSRKVQWLDPWATLHAYEEEEEARERGRLPSYAGSPESGLRNDFGWQLQGYIEDAEGRLRLQTREEHLFCMGCHGAIGATVDHTFALARKVPGAEGWRPQTLVGMPDAPLAGHRRGELHQYLERNGAADEFRANDELGRRFFRDGRLADDVLRAALPGGSTDLAALLLPSRERALALGRAYLGIVGTQSYALGREPVLGPVKSLFETVEVGQKTGLAEAGAVHPDGGPWLDWGLPATPPPSERPDPPPAGGSKEGPKEGKGR